MDNYAMTCWNIWQGDLICQREVSKSVSVTLDVWAGVHVLLEMIVLSIWYTIKEYLKKMDWICMINDTNMLHIVGTV